MKKKTILLVVLLLAVGFAAVTTTLFINGTTNIGTNKSDFEVYYSKAQVNGVEDNSVITDDTHIVFTQEMKSVGETYVLDYDVTNGSRNYDADLTMTCTASNEYLSVTNVFDDNTTLPATETRTGKLTIELIKGYVGETTKEVTIECTINANAVERNSLSNGTPADKVQQGVNLYNLIKSNAKTDTIDFSVNSMTSGTNGIYTTTATEGNKEVYYYRGAADQVNNNIIFNNMCWKIIRTTETGGVKLIYNGTPTDGKCEATGASTQIGTSKFNTSRDDNAYVGYMYGTAGSSTYAATHANTNESTIKKESIDPWFQANFDETATAKLEDTVFCNDRSTVAGGNNNTLNSSYGTLGYGKNATGYGALARASYFTQVPNPSLVCPNANDKFTVSSINGNGKLTYPVGLITLDEVVLAGYNTNKSNTSDYKNTTSYLHTGKDYWTFSPVSLGTVGNAYVGFVTSTGTVNHGSVNGTYGVRPVVSLADGTLVEPDGEGTSTKPYVVK